jgi:hypothetical protein
LRGIFTASAVSTTPADFAISAGDFLKMPSNHPACATTVNPARRRIAAGTPSRSFPFHFLFPDIAWFLPDREVGTDAAVSMPSNVKKRNVLINLRVIVQILVPADLMSSIPWRIVSLGRRVFFSFCFLPGNSDGGRRS